jgi:hypothetical protein
MKTFKTPKMLHDILGENQGVLEIVLIVIVSISIGLVLYLLY